MKYTIRTLALSAAASSLLLASSAFAAGQKIAVINFQEAMQKIPQTAQVMKKLQEEFKDKKAELVKLEEDLKYNQEKKKRDAAIMSEKDKKALDKKLTELFQQYQAKGQAFQQATQRRQGEETNKLIALIQQAAKNVAVDKKYDMVIEQKAVVYSTDNVSITDEVVKQVSKLK